MAKSNAVLLLFAAERNRIKSLCNAIAQGYQRLNRKSLTAME
jgi:hypothetical protein